jgi:hypothetical protein
MMRNTWKSLKTWCLSLAFLTHAALSVYLLVSCRYISLENSHFEGYLGLTSLESDDGQVSYHAYQLKCGEKDPLCSYVGRLEQAGAVLLTLLCLSATVEMMGMVQIWITKLLLVRAIKELDAGMRLSWWVRVGTTASKVTQFAVLADPLILLIGLIVWTLLSGLDELSGRFRISIASAFICLILKTALSLSVSAAQIVTWLDNHRRNAALLRSDPKPSVIHTDKPCAPAFTCED